MKKIYFTLLTAALFASNVMGQEQELKANTNQEGIVLKTGNDNFKVMLNGRIYMDGTHYIDDVTDLSSNVSISDIRLGTNITMGKWNAKINVAFGNEEVSIKDAFLRYNNSVNSFFTIGNFIEPFGLETAASSKELRFIGASNMSQAFGIGRGIGVGYTYHNDDLYGSTGIFAGSVDNHNKGDQGFSTTTKLAYAVINKEDLTVQFGGSFTYRKPEANGFSDSFNDDDFNREVIFTAGPEHAFLNADIKGAISDVRANFQTLVLAKSFLFQGEYTYSNVTRDKDYVAMLMKDGPLYYPDYTWPIAPGDYPAWYGEMKDISTQAYYMQAGYLLGDTYSYNSATAYINRPKNGSYEFLVRYDNTNLNDIDGTYFNGAFGPADEAAALSGAGNMSIAGGKSETYSAAINYYATNNIMFRLNYSVMNVNNITKPMDESIGILNARVQITF